MSREYLAGGRSGRPRPRPPSTTTSTVRREGEGERGYLGIGVVLVAEAVNVLARSAVHEGILRDWHIEREIKVTEEKYRVNIFPDGAWGVGRRRRKRGVVGIPSNGAPAWVCGDLSVFVSDQMRYINGL